MMRGFNKEFNVWCTHCKEDHRVKDVEFINVEEDISGRDVLEFTCPKTDKVAKSYVFGR